MSAKSVVESALSQLAPEHPYYFVARNGEKRPHAECVGVTLLIEEWDGTLDQVTILAVAPEQNLVVVRYTDGEQYRMSLGALARQTVSFGCN